MNMFSKPMYGLSQKGGLAEKVALDYDSLINGGDLVLVGLPDASGIVTAVERPDTDKKRMPPPDSAYKPLTVEEKKVLRDWITDGAPKAVLPRYSSLKDEIFSSRCADCHKAGGVAARVPLDYKRLDQFAAGSCATQFNLMKAELLLRLREPIANACHRLIRLIGRSMTKKKKLYEDG